MANLATIRSLSGDGDDVSSLRGDRQQRLKRVAVLGTYLPRQCGIATFTSDLCDALADEYDDLQCFVLAMNDRQAGYQYPERVRFELDEADPAAYRRAADFLDLGNVDVVCVQHEFGIFGGEAGEHVLQLLRNLRTPIVTTLHTVFQDPPSEKYREVFEELVQLSDRLVVISRCAADMLHQLHGVPRDKIDFIPHGIHDVPFVDPNFYKDKFDVEGRPVILTFGLLGPNKGIEHVIRALPRIVERHPNVVYIILGATHPYWIAREGEAYRDSLQRIAEELGVLKNVRFVNRFVGLQELLEYIGAAEIYITPYLEQQQISSGTLAYTVGAGKAVISTPYWYAEELLGDGRGRLVPFRSVDAIADEVTALLDNPANLHAMRKRAYLHGRDMTWAKVARQYMRTFNRAREERFRQPRIVSPAIASPGRPVPLPELQLEHVRRLTDQAGIVHRAVFRVPNYNEGYTTDDNARALVLSSLVASSEKIDDEARREARSLADTYLSYLWHAFDPATGRFRNRLSYQRTWLDEAGSEDAHGRALWALGTAAGRLDDGNLRGAAAQLFSQALPAASDLESTRGAAFTLIGINEYLRRFYGDHHAGHARHQISHRLLEMFREYSTSDWPWFEGCVAYSNAKLPHALILTGRWIESEEMVSTGLRALEWLNGIQSAELGHFAPIGNNGFYPRDGAPARFDQQPVEAHATISACLEAYELTGDDQWRSAARKAFNWFLGHNDLGLALYDPTSGGCRDALHADRVNPNQGAEATLSFLLSLVELRTADRTIGARPRLEEANV